VTFLPHDGHKGPKKKKPINLWKQQPFKAKNMEDFGSKFLASTSLRNKSLTLKRKSIIKKK
jgi:hypothetical protein